MKRTKQTYFRQFPTQNETEAMSGCKQFQGEDLKYDSRRQYFKQKQKEWLDQQIQEKKAREEQAKYQQGLYDTQTLELNRMRGMLEDNFSKTKSSILGDVTETNKQLELERKEKQHREQLERLEYERNEAERLKARGAKQPFVMNLP